MPWIDTTEIQFNAGRIDFYYKDTLGGYSAFTINSLDLTAYQVYEIVQPFINCVKYQKSYMTGGDSTTSAVAYAQEDTIEYAILVENIGNDTALEVFVTDASVFDTLLCQPVALVSMETAGADSWTYADTDGTWQNWGDAPPAGDIKGLKWKIDSLGIGEARELRFTVRIK